MSKHDESLFEDTKMTFGEHLEELRVCLTKAIIGLVIGSAIGLLLAKQVMGVIQSPIEKALREHFSKLAVEELKGQYVGEITPGLEEFVGKWALVFDEVYIENAELERIAAGFDAEGKREKSTLTPEQVIKQSLPVPNASFTKTRIWRTAEAQLTALSVHEGFMIWLKAGFVFGIIVASPYIFLQIWLFVAAGLYPHERKYVYVYLPFSLALFLIGSATAFFFVFGPVLNFLFGFARMLDIAPDLRISEVISFVLFLPLGFGIAFQLPLVMLFLHRIGLFTVEAYLEKWRIAVLVIFVISMMLTPADPYSMLLMAGPLTGLYFLGIAMCRWMPRGENPFNEAYEP
ncbi:MAG: twin-arginine translocase subunit TatC [Planctomycetaceae bacterium]|nr:twin-arginine translocase subunit TatC [Planctomycetaceae bacterium]